ncbi:MAG: polyphenol oxidase family protein, partial [Gemmatimonadales bacterium]
RPAEGLLLSRGLDGHVTASRGVLLGVTTADCVPVYLLHQKSGTIGLVHAGWRGTRDGVLMAAVRKVCRIAGEGPWDLVMHCGVSICGSCYEVGPEVLSMFGGDAERGPGKLDLRAVLAGQAQALGIERVTVSSWCTLHHEGSFHSHRGSGAGGGRMLAYLGRPRA